MSFDRILRSLWLSTIALAPVACAKVSQPEPNTVPLTEATMVSNTASVTHTLVFDGERSLMTCTAPPPDAMFSQGESASLNVSSFAGSREGGSEGENSGESGLPGRTPGVLMTRELFFRACEFSQNYQLDSADALALYRETMQMVAEGWAKEAAHTAVTISETSNQAAGTPPFVAPMAMETAAMMEADTGMGAAAMPVAPVMATTTPDNGVTDMLAVEPDLPDTTGF